MATPTKEATTIEFTHPVIEKLRCLIQARVPIIYLKTWEESRAVTELSKIAEGLKRETWIWSAHSGLLPMVKEGTQWVPAPIDKAIKESINPRNALVTAEAQEIPSDGKSTAAGNNGAIYIMRDLHCAMTPIIQRILRDYFDSFPIQKKTIIITAPEIGDSGSGQHRPVLTTLEKQVTIVEWTLPDRSIIKKLLLRALANFKATSANGKVRKLQYTDQELDEIVSSLQGLSEHEIENAVAVCVIEKDCLDPMRLLQEKKQILLKTEILEYIDTDAYEIDQVGGLDEAKKYFSRYALANSLEAREAHVDPLKGVLITGVPGTGKSLIAKTIGKMWKRPTVRLDVGKVMAGVVGASESRMRQALDQIEALSPAVCWVDEIDKSLSGTGSSNFSDGGTIARVFGTLLTRMQEGMKDVTIIATANNITALPPELIRRFNEVFFVDLPSEEERAEIFAIHLKKRAHDPKEFKMDCLVASSKHYTGAEIEKAIQEAKAEAFTQKQKLSDEILIKALEDTRPVAQVMADQIKHLRDWARTSARYASSAAKTAAEKRNASKKKKEINLDELVETREKPKDMPQPVVEASPPTTTSGDRFEDL